MTVADTNILFLVETLIFTSIILIHLSSRYSSIIFLYTAQSLLIVALLSRSMVREPSVLLAISVVATFLVKVVIAPYLFYRQTKKYGVQLGEGSYFKGPVLLIILAAVSVIGYVSPFSSLTNILALNQQAIAISISSMFLSILIVINDWAVLTQIIGILSLENSIVSFAILAGLEQTATLQLGVLFDIIVWILIAKAFISMIYEHFGSLDVTTMRHLKEE